LHYVPRHNDAALVADAFRRAATGPEHFLHERQVPPLA
jgi:hypothetical protein